MHSAQHRADRKAHRSTRRQLDGLVVNAGNVDELAQLLKAEIRFLLRQQGADRHAWRRLHEVLRKRVGETPMIQEPFEMVAARTARTQYPGAG